MGLEKHAKESLKTFRQELFNRYLVSDGHTLRMPAMPSSFVLATSREDIYSRVEAFGSPGVRSDHVVSFIEKNNKPYCFTWRTSGKNLRKAVRSEIIPAESITGKVLNTLGRYHSAAHERAIKGLVSNMHRTKISLLDHYQDRVEALQEIESLVNKRNFSTLKQDYKQVFEAYLEKLRNIQRNINVKDLGVEVAKQLRADIEEDIQRAKAYYFEVSNPKNTLDDLRSFDAARGPNSVLEFVKNQMIFNLYEMQGINQDITYSEDKTFALTRGVMNDCIEDARRVIDDHRASIHDLVLPQHHGVFGKDDELLVYNFEHDHLTPDQEREILAGISFVEGWDATIYNKKNEPQLYVPGRAGASTINVEGELEEFKKDLRNMGSLEDDNFNNQVAKKKKTLENTIAAQQRGAARPLVETPFTNWQTSANAGAFFQKIGSIVLNAFLSVIGRTQPRDENPWQQEKDVSVTNDGATNTPFSSYSAMLRASPFVRTGESRDEWYIKVIRLIFNKRAHYDADASWYIKIKCVILGDSIYSSHDSYFTRIRKIIVRIKDVFVEEVVPYSGARPNEPLWRKPVGFILSFFSTGKNVLLGFKAVFKELFYDLWRTDVYYDYLVAQKLPDIKATLASAEKEFENIAENSKLYMNGYEVNFMLAADEPLEKNKIYIDVQNNTLRYVMIDPSSHVKRGQIAMTEFTSDVLPDLRQFRGDVLELREYFRPFLPTIIDIAHDRGDAYNYVGVNELIRSRKSPADAENFQLYGSKTFDQYPSIARLATMPFRHALSDQNDILMSVARGLNGFVSFFSDNFVKDPVSAAVFGTGYGFIGGSVLLPNVFAFLGPSITGWAQTLGLAVASGGASSAVASGCLVGQMGSAIVDIVEHGPQSSAVKTVSMVLENPLSIAVGFSAAWLAGHMLTISIPVLRHDLGTNEDIGKLTFGGKGAVALHEALEKAEKNPGNPIKFTVDGAELELSAKKMTSEQLGQYKKLRFASWLIEHHDKLGMLSKDTKNELARQIDDVFKSELDIAKALKKFIFPKEELSIAQNLVQIPLSYIPALVRCVVSFISSAITGSTAPMQRAWGDLGAKITKDLSRLLYVGEAVVHLLGNIIGTAFKVPTLLILLGVGRLAGLFGFRIGHPTHKIMAGIHVAWRELGEILFPLTALTATAEEHPCSAAERVHSSQARVMEGLGVKHDVPVQAANGKSNPTAIPVPATSAPRQSAAGIRSDLIVNDEDSASESYRY